MRNKLNSIFFIIFLLGLTHFSKQNHADDEIPILFVQSSPERISLLPLPKQKPSSHLSSSYEPNTLKDTRSIKLNKIANKIFLQRIKLKENLKLLEKVETLQDKNSIQAELDDSNKIIKEQERSFEMIQTDGLELEEIEDLTKTPFDWKKELLEIIKPIFKELHQLTEDKREIVNLENKIPTIESQIQDIRERLDMMTQINRNGLESEALKQFEKINNRWQRRLEEKQDLLEIVRLQLDEVMKSQAEEQVSIGGHLKKFAKGRGATLFFAVTVFITVYFLLMQVWKGVLWLNKRKQKVNQQSYFIRVFTLAYYTTTVIFSITATFYVLNLRNDQVLIGVVIILLISVIWVLRNSLPRYINELKILLNAGSVRENECILYNGIPMKVTNLNFYTKLTNPALPKLTLRLPLSELSSFISRPCREDEPWFPCQEGDFVMLTDNTFKMVQHITLENVILTLPNGMMPQTYSIGTFLAEKPKNFSRGFLVTSNFGVDYKHQQECTTKVPGLLCAGILKGLQQETYGDYVKDISVYFSQANSSSLDYKIVALLDGRAAINYYAITRDLQRYAVEACNQQQWEIPFTQLVVHSAQN